MATITAATLRISIASKRIKQRALARKLGLTESGLSEMLNGNRRLPPETAQRIHDALQTWGAEPAAPVTETA